MIKFPIDLCCNCMSTVDDVDCYLWHYNLRFLFLHGFVFCYSIQKLLRLLLMSLLTLMYERTINRK